MTQALRSRLVLAETDPAHRWDRLHHLMAELKQRVSARLPHTVFAEEDRHSYSVVEQSVELAGDDPARPGRRAGRACPVAYPARRFRRHSRDR